MAALPTARPKPFLQVLTRDLSLEPALLALCAGFEAEQWRADQLARHLIEWLPDFALSHSERESFGHATGVEMLGRAARAVYASDRYRHRGEFGELLLHAILRQEFGTETAISKIFFKDTPNATVHGFDAVHVVATEAQGLELWLGEVKFYGDVTDAMTAVAAELRAHTERDWLATEMLAIANKVDPAWPHAPALLELVHRNTPMDELIDRLRVPVLVTYDSETVAAATRSDDAYRAAFAAEVRELQQRFARRRLPQEVVIHLLLLPLAEKQRLVDALHARLRAVQSL